VPPCLHLEVCTAELLAVHRALSLPRVVLPLVQDNPDRDLHLVTHLMEDLRVPDLLGLDPYIQRRQAGVVSTQPLQYRHKVPLDPGVGLEVIPADLALAMVLAPLVVHRQALDLDHLVVQGMVTVVHSTVVLPGVCTIPGGLHHPRDLEQDLDKLQDSQGATVRLLEDRLDRCPR